MPAERMKAGHEYRVPLSAAAMDTLAALRSILRRDAGEGYCGRRRRRYHSKRAMNSA